MLEAHLFVGTININNPLINYVSMSFDEPIID